MRAANCTGPALDTGGGPTAGAVRFGFASGHPTVETEPSRFSIHRLAHYCLDLSELLDTQRVVPVVIFLHQGAFPERLRLGGDAGTYLDFRFQAYALPKVPAREHFDSPNLVARLNLPNMAYRPDEKLEVYAKAMRGLTMLEPTRSGGSSTWISSTSTRRWTRMNASSTASGTLSLPPTGVSDGKR
jgi:hypothetical protein